MKKLKCSLVVINLLVVLFSCSLKNQELKENEFNSKDIQNKNGNKGIFRTTLFYDNTENKSLDKVLIKIAKVIPKKEFETFYSAPLAPLPLIVEHKEEKLPIVNSKDSIKIEKEFIQNEPIEIYLEEGEYYVSLDTFTLREIKFDPVENPILFVSLGYTYDENFKNIQFYKGSKCINKYEKYGRFFLANRNICGNLKIQKGKVTKLNVYGKERSLNIVISIFKWIPGIVFLAPFWNFYYYYTRQYEVELLTENILNFKMI